MPQRLSNWPLLLASFCLLAACSSLQHPTSVTASLECSTKHIEETAKSARGDWKLSYRAGCTDKLGRRAGGSEILHLVAHRGALFAANGYWMDEEHEWYGGKARPIPWGQVLRLDAVAEGWQVDAMFDKHLRIESLSSVRFTTDHQGRALDEPIDMLIAAAFEGNGQAGINLFQRDDARARWTKIPLVKGPLGERGVANSVRVITLYHDKRTGVDRLFIAAGTHGIWSGSLVEPQTLKLHWDRAPGFGPLPIRALSMIEANGALHLSVGSHIYRRIDGERPSYELVASLDSVGSDGLVPSVGGIRGMTAIPNPSGQGQSLLFLWSPGKFSRACILRLDPDPADWLRYQAPVVESCLDDLIERHLRGIPVRFVLGAYNHMYALKGPLESEPILLFGVEAVVGDREAPTASNQAMGEGGFYAGAIVVARKGPNNYRLTEVNCYTFPSESALVAVRTITASPFKDEADGELFIGGYDANFHRGRDTAWIFRAKPEVFLRLFASPESAC